MMLRAPAQVGEQLRRTVASWSHTKPVARINHIEMLTEARAVFKVSSDIFYVRFVRVFVCVFLRDF